MFLSLSDILILLEQYRYWLIFPIMFFEGPIITVISGFLVSLGVLNFLITYVLLIIADLFGDSFHYWIGRYWRNSTFIKRFGFLFGYNEKSVMYLEKHFNTHRVKSYVVAKFSHGIGTAIQIAAGIAKTDFWEFLWINFLGTIPKTLVFLLVGYYVGHSYEKISQYLNSFALILISLVIMILFFVFLGRFSKKYFKIKDDNLE